MHQGEDGLSTPAESPYDEAMEALSSLITKRTRADKSNNGDRFELMFDYFKMMDLEEPVSNLKVIHVAGTKGKGSTCAFSESILRNCGFRTGLFTSPHLIDVRERFRLDGVDISEEKFLTYFWWCWHRLKEQCNDDMPMPSYFRFLSLLAFKIFCEEQVEVAILEVGLGGKFDATNAVEKPIVCGISSLGFDHMEILGNTLGAIAGEKAGIFKQGVPAFTAPQLDEPMQVLEEKASELNVPLQVVTPLDKSLHLGLDGEHQYINAALAVALCSTWLQKTGHSDISYLEQTRSLPETFLKGLSTAGLQGRAQIVADPSIEPESPGDLVFYLDGAHSPESMEVCAKWFSVAIKEENDKNLNINSQKKSKQILLFNCMPVRDPALLLPPLMTTCSKHGVHFEKALFVPNISVYNKVGNSALPSSSDHQVDLSWQLNLQRVWENLSHGERGLDSINSDILQTKDITDAYDKSTESSTVLASLPMAINWLREQVRQNESTRLQVLVTGSLHLVGDLLKTIKK